MKRITAEDPDRPRLRDDLDTDVAVLRASWQEQKGQIENFLDSRSGWGLVESNEHFAMFRFDRPQDARRLRQIVRPSN